MRKAVFVDRDDTLCPDVPYCSNPNQIKVFPGVPESVRRLNEAGYLVIIATNQSGIGRGYFTKAELDAVNGELLRQIESGGGHIDDIFYCPHTPSDNCDCRKPKIGMGLQAIRKYDLNPSECWMIGDHDKDMEFGKALGFRTFRVTVEKTFSDAVDEILTNM